MTPSAGAQSEQEMLALISRTQRDIDFMIDDDLKNCLTGLLEIIKYVREACIWWRAENKTLKKAVQEASIEGLHEAARIVYEAMHESPPQSGWGEIVAEADQREKELNK